jgi:hypothetical protein
MDVGNVVGSATCLQHYRSRSHVLNFRLRFRGRHRLDFARIRKNFR